MLLFTFSDYYEFKNISLPDPWIMWRSENSHKMDHLNSDYPFGKAIFIQQHMIDYHFLWEPKLKPRILQNFKLKEKYVKMANETIKKMVKKKNFIPVGIHVRKGDYIRYEKGKNLLHLSAEFYVKSMNVFKKKLGKKTVFLLITDDIKWCQDNLPKRKDLFIVSDPGKSKEEGVGHDLAIMSLCQHSIVSRGTFSRWSKFLAGGKSMSPHFLEN